MGKRLRGTLILFWFTAALFGQQVEKVAGLYVLLSSDQVGKIGDTVVIVRDTPEGLREAGVIRLVRFQNGKAAGKIERETPLGIRKGDRVKPPQPSEPAPVPAALKKPSTPHAVVRVIPGYALLDLAGNLTVGDELEIRRAVSGKEETVGKVRVIKITQALAAARILSESVSSRIQPGDEAVSRGNETPVTVVAREDIDYYFYGAFRSE
jgi:hypothetical protein